MNVGHERGKEILIGRPEGKRQLRKAKREYGDKF
jgi:hypothetical protein